MKSLVTQLKESLVTETNNTVCGLCPVCDPDKPNQKEFEKSENGFSELIAWLEEMYKS